MSMHPSMMHSISKCGRQIGVTDVISKFSFSQSLSESQQRDGYIVRFIIQRTIGVEIKLPFRRGLILLFDLISLLSDL